MLGLECTDAAGCQLYASFLFPAIEMFISHTGDETARALSNGITILFTVYQNEKWKKKKVLTWAADISVLTASYA